MSKPKPGPRMIALPGTEFSIGLCQRILFRALEWHCSNSHLQHTYNPFYSYEEASELIRLFGKEIFIFHPEEVQKYFGGVDSTVFNEIENLYCSQASRSIEMVSKIINFDRISQSLAPISEKAIWGICLYLDENRQEVLRVSTSKLGTWEIVPVFLPHEFIIDNIKQKVVQAVIVCEYNTNLRVLGFSFGTVTNEISDAAKQALYSALLLKREPRQTVMAGLTWQIPETIKLASSLLLSQGLDEFCQSLGIAIEVDERIQDRIATLTGTTWPQDIRATRYSLDHLNLVFDTYLYRAFGFGPHRDQKSRDAKSKHLIGYNRDPLWQFPSLRYLLREVASEIGTNGSVECRGMQFRSRILQFFIGEKVNIVQAPGWQRTAWIYNHAGDFIDYIGR